MEVINELDLQGRLKIIQDNQMNNFTMDSILLANFVKLRKKDNLIVDLCSGNGPISMLLTLKKEEIFIKAVELQEKNCELFKKSLKLNKLEEKIEIYNDNVIGISDIIGKNKYDVIVCNPPYFRVDDSSNTNENTSYSIARHELEINLEQVIIESKKLLNNTGTLYLVHRPDRLDEIIIKLNEYNFELKTIQLVHPFINKEANVVLIEAKKGKSVNNKLKVLKPIYVYKEINEYTEDMLEIMKLKGE